MINSVTLQNFRGIRQGSLSAFAPITFFVGRNGSGKTAVLDALLIGASHHPLDAIGRAVSRHPSVPDGGRWLLWRGGIEGPTEIALVADDYLRTTTLTGHLEGDPERMRIDARIDAKDASDLISIPVAAQVRWNGHGIYNGVEVPLAGEWPEVRLLLSHLGAPGKPLHAVFSDVVRNNLREDAMVMARTVVDGLKGMEVLADGDTPSLYITMDDATVVPATMTGDGVQALLRLSMELALRPGGTVLLEEPELHQHPGALLQTAKAIVAAAARGVQVVLTTHSLDLIDFIYRQAREAEVDYCGFRLALTSGSLASTRFDAESMAQARETLGEDLR